MSNKDKNSDKLTDEEIILLNGDEIYLENLSKNKYPKRKITFKIKNILDELEFNN